MLCLFPAPTPPDICAIFHMPVKSFCALASQHIIWVTLFTNTVPLFCQSAVKDDLSGIHYVTCMSTGEAQRCSLPVLQCVYTCCSTLNFASVEYLFAWVCICTAPVRSWVHLPAELEEERCEFPYPVLKRTLLWGSPEWIKNWVSSSQPAVTFWSLDLFQSQDWLFHSRNLPCNRQAFPRRPPTPALFSSHPLLTISI